VLVFHEERERSTGQMIIRLVDFLARGVAQDMLIGALVQTARSRGAAFIDFYCSLDCYDAALTRAGFFNEADHDDGRIAALFQPLDFRKTTIRALASPLSAKPTTARDWYLTKADSDQDRPNDRRLLRAS
jgi:hypothetical protein